MEGKVFSFHDVPAGTKKELTELIKDYGGEVLYVGKNITHLITTKEEAAANGFKIQTARAKGIQIVGEEFVPNLIKTLGLKPKPKPVPIPVDAVTPQNEEEEITSTLSKPKITKVAPAVNLVLPDMGPLDGDTPFKVAIFGINFAPSTKFHIRIGNVICRDIEYHCSTAVVVTVNTKGVVQGPGEVKVCATNDGGKQYGMTSSFRFYDPSQYNPISSKLDHNAIAMSGQLQNLRRTIEELQSGLANVKKMESHLRDKLEGIGYKLDQPLPWEPQEPVESKLRIVTPEPEPKSVPTATSTLATTPTESPVAPKPSKKGVKQGKIVQQDRLDREIRLFISSPFKDMQDERDLIVKKVIPRIRKLCADRDIGFSHVDLRWGVTESQSEQAATLLMCLREIQKCNVFLGAYGERYGWALSQNSSRNPTAQDDLLKKTFLAASKEFPWINEFSDRSVTEVEMRMILAKKHAGEAKQAFFYLRDPYYVEKVSSDKKHLYKPESEFESEKLTLLKEDITGSEYPSGEYDSPDEMAELFYADFQNYVDINFPPGEALSPFESEKFKHNSFAKNLTRVYLANEQCFMNLDIHASAVSSTPLIVVGESGVGKSALIANWAKRYREHHPEDVVVTHYVGCSPMSTHYPSMLSRIMFEIQDQTSDYRSKIPTNSQELVESFSHWLEEMLNKHRKKRIVLAIDGLDNLDEREDALTFLWLPLTFNSTVRVILSTSYGSVYNTLKRRQGYGSLIVSTLEIAERVSFLRMNFNLSSKKLTEDQEHKIANNPQSGNPRYLKTLVEDLSLFGEFDELNEKINKDLRAQSASELYEIVLARIETDYDKSNKSVVKRFLSLLWASRRGLYLETEMTLLLQEYGIEDHEWAPVFVILEELLFSASGLLNFANRDIRKAAENRYLNTPEEKIEVHSILGDFFELVEGVTARKIEETPFHYEKSGQWEKLRNFTSDLRNFDKLFTPTHKFDLYRYWRNIEAKANIDPVTCYLTALGYTDQFPSGELVADLFYRVGSFLEEIAKYNGAEEVFRKARYYYELSSQNLDVAKMEYSIGRCLLAMDKYREAEELLKRALELYIREKGDDDIDVSHVLNRMGSLYTHTNKIQQAEECFTKSLRIREAKLGANHSRVGQTLKHLLTFYEEIGNLPKAAECGEKALKIMEEVFGLDHPNVAGILLRLGHLYTSQKRYKLAKSTLKRALSISETIFGADHPMTADLIYELGVVYLVKPEELNQNKSWSSDKAENFFVKALKIKEAALGPNHTDVARIVNRLGALYIERVEFVLAEEYFKRALKIREEKLGVNHSRVAQTLKHFLTLYELQEKFRDAIKAGERALKITQKLNGSDSTAAAHILVRLGQLRFTSEGCSSIEGKNNLQEAIRIFEKSLGASHKTVQEIKHMYEELSAPPLAPVIVSKPVAKRAVREEQEMAIPDMDISAYFTMPPVGAAAPAPPPPPPPPPPMGIPLPPPIPGAKSPAQAVPAGALLNSIENFSKEKKKLKSAAAVQKKKNFDAAGWWKQNYAYVAPPTSSAPISKPAPPPSAPMSKPAFK